MSLGDGEAARICVNCRAEPRRIIETYEARAAGRGVQRESGFDGGRSDDSEEDGMDEEETWFSEMEGFSGQWPLTCRQPDSLSRQLPGNLTLLMFIKSPGLHCTSGIGCWRSHYFEKL